MKKIIRWTIGNVLPNGYLLLRHSIKSFIECYGKNFDFYVCYNNIERQFIQKHIKNLPVNLIEQNWGDININLNANKYDTTWKLIPPSINDSTHQLFIDNDIVFIKPFYKIKAFLSSDVPIFSIDNYPWLGIYEKYFKPDSRFNAGLFGIPPKFNFKEKIITMWSAANKPISFRPQDEQGLVAYLLSKENPIIINTQEIPIIGFPIHYHSWTKYYGLHLCNTNSQKNHLYFKAFINESLI